MQQETMLDLETHSTRPNAVIIAIGAVKFDQDGLKGTFYVNIDPQTCVDVGLHTCEDTLIWWAEQTDLAKHKLKADKLRLKDALAEFSEWYERGSHMWGNGAGFDNVILRSAYEACDMTAPWRYWDDRCYRTVRELRPEVKFIKPVIAHYALDDAKAQAKHLIRLRKKL